MIDVLRIQIEDERIKLFPPLDEASRGAVKNAKITGITDFGEDVTPEGSLEEIFGFADKSSELIIEQAESIETAVNGLGRSALILDARAKVERPRVIEAPRARRHGGAMLRRLVRA